MKKVILVTGASSGIGLQIATHLASEHIVYGTSRKKTEVKGVNMLVMDLNDEVSIKNAVRSLIEKEATIDVLINNAGVGITGPVEETPINAAKNVFQTNVFGSIALTNEVLPYMRKKKDGDVFFVTSIAGYMGLPYRAYYSASKAALISLVEALSMEVKAFNIRIKSIAPGDFATNIAAGRFTVSANENSPYKAYQHSLQLMNEHVSKGDDPLVIAHKIEAILASKPKRIHHKVGSFLQKFSVHLKHLLPDYIYEKMLMNHYKL